MSRWIRRQMLLGAGISLVIGAAFLPWATWKNLNGVQFPGQVTEMALEQMRFDFVPTSVIDALRPLKNVQFTDRESFDRAVGVALGNVPGGIQFRPTVDRYTRSRVEGFFTLANPKDQPICYVNAFSGTGDYEYQIFVFRHRRDGTLLGIAGDPQIGPVADEAAMFGKVQVEYELVEDKTVTSPYWSGSRKLRNSTSDSNSPIAALILLTVLLLGWAAFTRFKILATILTLPALAIGIYPLAALQHFVADATRLGMSGIVLDPAIGAGAYVMLAGGILAAFGGLIVWLEPTRSSAQAPNRVTTELVDPT